MTLASAVAEAALAAAGALVAIQCVLAPVAVPPWAESALAVCGCNIKSTHRIQE